MQACFFRDKATPQQSKQMLDWLSGLTEEPLLDVQLNPLYDADHDVVAPHGLIGQSWDGDGVGVDEWVPQSQLAPLRSYADDERLWTAPVERAAGRELLALLGPADREHRAEER